MIPSRGECFQGGQPLKGVSVSSSSFGTVQTVADGYYYSFWGRSGTSYTLTPSKSGYSFTSSSRSGTSYCDTAQNFSGALNQHTISGRVTFNGVAFPGVTIAGLGTTKLTDLNGFFSFTNMTHGTTFTLTPSRPRYYFYPICLTSSETGDAAVNFLGGTSPLPTPTKTPAIMPTPTPTSTQTSALPVNLTSPVKQLADGNTYSVAIVEDGTLWARGDNSFGQLGMEPHSIAIFLFTLERQPTGGRFQQVRDQGTRSRFEPMAPSGRGGLSKQVNWEREPP